MHKKNARMYTLILVASLIFTGCAAKTDADNDRFIEDWEQVNEGVHMKSKLTEVNITTDAFSILIEPSTDEMTHVNLNSTALEEIKKYFDIAIRETDDQLLDITIKGKKSSNIKIKDLVKMWKAELHIQLPAHEYNRITIGSNLGRIEYNHVDVKLLDVNNDVGEIVVQDTNTQQVNIKNSVGSIRMNNVNGKMTVKSDVGSVQMNLQNIEDDMDVKTEVGAVTIAIEHEPEQVNLNLSTEIGRARTNIDIDYDKQSKGTVKGQKGTNGPEIKVSSSLGVIEVNHK